MTLEPLGPPRPAAARRPGGRRRPQRTRAAPSGWSAGLDLLRGWDLDPVVAPHVLDTHPSCDYLAGTDEDRARDLQEAWCDPSVAAVLCARGGYGAQRMVDLLDWAAMRAAGPKVFVGYSDITVLHEAFAAAGRASRPCTARWSPPRSSSRTRPPGRSLRATLFEPETVRTLGLAGARPWCPARARGVTSAAASACSPPTRAPRAPARPPRGGLLLSEDVGGGAVPPRPASSPSCCARAGWTGSPGSASAPGRTAARTNGCGRCSPTGSAGSGCRWSRSSGSGTATGADRAVRRGGRTGRARRDADPGRCPTLA